MRKLFQLSHSIHFLGMLDLDFHTVQGLVGQTVLDDESGIAPEDVHIELFLRIGFAHFLQIGREGARTLPEEDCMGKENSVSKKEIKLLTPYPFRSVQIVRKLF